MGYIRARLASFSLSLPLLAVVGLTVGCGDNVPGQTGTGGSVGVGGGSGGGSGGTGGAIDGGSGGVAGSPTDGGAGGVGGATGGVGGGTGGVGGGTGGVGGKGGVGGSTGGVGGGTGGVGGKGGAGGGTGGTVGTGGVVGATGGVGGGTGGATGGTGGVISTGGVGGGTGGSAPTCTISKPVLSPTHPDLNGVPTPQGDRSSSLGSPYQATFVINTNAEDGQTVTLAVDNALAPGTPVDGTPTATVSGGSASFGLTLDPDGTYEVVATCVNKSGLTASSTKTSFTVDTLPPVLTVNSPIAGQFVAGGTISACAQTTSSDAASLVASLGSGQNNLCVTLGSSATPSCVAVSAVSTPACVVFPCPGSAPFSLTFTLNDAAGNPTSQTVTGVTCASSGPSVQIIAPASDAPTFTDPTKHILAANALIGIPDEDATTAGAQADVVACTDTAGTATLSVGHKGDTSLVQLDGAITTATATTGDNCPNGLGFVARFSGVTLPESTENADGTLAAATELQVSVTSAANSAESGTSLSDDVWVDSVAPGLVLTSPAGLCGSFTQSPTTVTEDVSYAADDNLVVANVTNNGVTTAYDLPAFVGGVATFGNVAFVEGQNALVATENDPAGNTTALATCTVTIGSAPVVTFTTPTAGALLCSSGATSSGCIDDTDPSTPGWQGNLAVTVTASGSPVNGSQITFTDGATTFGSALTDAAGHAQFNGATIPEGTQTILATTDNVPGAGVGSGTVTVTVDTTAPNAPTNLNASVIDRRKTSMQLTWTAPSDSGGGNVAGYQIRYAKVPIDASNFNNSAVTTAVTFSGTPATAGHLDGIIISPLYIESTYYFAVEATDATGNPSAMLATPSGGTCDCTSGRCCAAHFNQSIINSPAGTPEVFGASSDGSGDVNGDKISDIIVGTSNGSRAYLFLGSSTFAAGAPSVTFSSATDTLFGTGVAQIGDIDGDGFQDIAIADLSISVVYIYKGRANWPATRTDLQADYVISTSGLWTSASPGSAMARLGDFDGDGIDDFAIAGPTYNTRVGEVAVVYGSKTFSSFTLPDATRELDIGGDSTLNRTEFGLRMVGLGHFYSATTGTTLVVSAPGLGAATSTSANEGRLYAFHGRPVGAAIDVTSADAVFVGPGKGAEIGQVLMNLGPLVNGLASLGSGNGLDTLSVPGDGGTGFVFSGAATTSPFASNAIVDEPSALQAGQMLFGGGISGRDIPFSLIGSSKVDVAIVGSNNVSVDIIDGAVFSGLSSPINADQTAAVRVPLPADWASTTVNGGGLIPDINNDGIPDFVLGDTTGNSQGRIIIFW